MWTVPVTVEYRLTDLGHSLATAVSVIRVWAYANVEAILAARVRAEQSAAGAGDLSSAP
ncbi:winged helix-turn-helix transcriptional regulator [Actinoplanes sp. NPDC051346]|uniref:winged helix-turn-helix transcriptional regulator n=1 Tax=Actinoplanes sp. NPDC051346 TaxID=3155048 RepID=UPI00341DC280